MLKERLLKLPRRQKRLLQIAADMVLVWVALALALAVRFGPPEALALAPGYRWLFILAPLISLPVFAAFRLYHTVTRYFSNQSMLVVVKATAVAALLLAFAIYLRTAPPAPIPRSLVFNYWGLTVLLLGGLRLAMHQYLVGNWPAPHAPFQRPREDQRERVVIYGAGVSGNQLVHALRASGDMVPLAFVDDDPSIAGQMIAGLKVYGPDQVGHMLRETGATQILLATPSASRARRREILRALEGYEVRVRTVPKLTDLASGRVAVSDIREVGAADLLGRDSVPPRTELLDRCVRGRRILVTGAGGSIGSELCRQIVEREPTTLVLYEHSEYNLYAIHQALRQIALNQGLQVNLIPVLGSVRNRGRLTEIMRLWSVETVYHAAAYKHVPIVENNLVEGIHNNVLGTFNAALAAIQNNVRHFVLISTDKAVRPTNVMGASKRFAEMILQALSAERAVAVDPGNPDALQLNNTCFTMVRFGNVLDSSGSVIPLFRRQIRRGGPVTVTHSQITRYFMTVEEAALLVIQAGSLGEGGDVFLLDMGEPVQIYELARNMIRLSGLSVRDETNPTGDIAIKFTGLRPGEKLYEELLIDADALPTEHPRICRANETCLDWATLSDHTDALREAVQNSDYLRIRELLCETVQGYQPDEEISDLLYQQLNNG